MCREPKLTCVLCTLTVTKGDVILVLTSNACMFERGALCVSVNQQHGHEKRQRYKNLSNRRNLVLALYVRKLIYSFLLVRPQRCCYFEVKISVVFFGVFGDVKFCIVFACI